MVQHMVVSITDHLTWFPAKTGISKVFSPYTLLSQKQIDFRKRLQFSLGEYVQANHIHTIKNNNLPRSFDAIYLRSVDSEQGGHKVLDLSTGKVKVRSRVLPCNMTKLVIDRVHELARRQGYETLKFFHRKGQATVYSPDLLAGVGEGIRVSNELGGENVNLPPVLEEDEDDSAYEPEE